MINEEVYLEMKKLIAEYENPTAVNEEQPYLEEISVEVRWKYNPNYGDDNECKCGHSYYRHFDSYEKMEAIGCKYCSCREFVEAK